MSCFTIKTSAALLAGALSLACSTPPTIVSTLDVSGVYVGGDMAGGGAAQSKPNFRMRAGVIETPKGAYFIKLVAPRRLLIGGIRPSRSSSSPHSSRDSPCRGTDRHNAPTVRRLPRFSCPRRAPESSRRNKVLLPRR